MPSQSRSRELVEVIVEAGLLILEEKGPDAITTRSIAERAGVSVGSLYQYFSNKDEILESIYRRKNEKFWTKAATWVPRLAAMPLEEALQLIVHVMIQRHQRLYELHPEFFLEHASRFRLTTFKEDSHEQATQWVGMILECHREVLRIESPSRAAFMMSRTLGSIMLRICRERPEYLGEPEFEADLVRMLCALLIQEKPPVPTEPPESL